MPAAFRVRCDWCSCAPRAAGPLIACNSFHSLTSPLRNGKNKNTHGPLSGFYADAALRLLQRNQIYLREYCGR
jgi:hypothetical protein